MMEDGFSSGLDSFLQIFLTKSTFLELGKIFASLGLERIYLW